MDIDNFPIMPINYKLIGEAITFYEYQSFEYIDVPWEVSLQDIENTGHKGIKDFLVAKGSTTDTFLVGSAEQSLVRLLKTSKETVNVMSVTPCFRGSDRNRDSFHFPYFMKLELMQTNPAIDFVEAEIEGMAETAYDFFAQYLDTKYLSIVGNDGTHSGIDIQFRGIELGSYGYRTLPDGSFSWIYGTGLAEPRFSQARKIG